MLILYYEESKASRYKRSKSADYKVHMIMINSYLFILELLVVVYYISGICMYVIKFAIFTKKPWVIAPYNNMFALIHIQN